MVHIIGQNEWISREQEVHRQKKKVAEGEGTSSNNAPGSYINSFYCQLASFLRKFFKCLNLIHASMN